MDKIQEQKAKVDEFFTKYKQHFLACAPNKYPNTLRREIAYLHNILKIMPKRKIGANFGEEEYKEWREICTVDNLVADEIDHLRYLRRKHGHDNPSSQLLPHIHAVISQ